MKTKYHTILKVIAAIVTVALSAQITIDVGSIPVTGQTLGILIWAFFLSPIQALISIGLYVIIGICGVPVFADGSSGLSKLMGGSGGYLIGFIIAATLVSYLHNKKKSTTFASILLLTTLGTVVILFFGIGRLFTIYGLGKAFEYGFYPFWQGALLKVILGSFIVWGIKRILKRLL